MSAASVRRIKERGGGGGGGKISPAPAGKASPVPVRSISAGKENPRPTSRVGAATQKPTLKPMARVDKSALSAVPADESRSRWSTSSVLRGRSSSPSVFMRAESDLKKNPSRVYVGSARGKENGASLKGVNGKSGKKSDLDKRFGKDSAENGEFLGEVESGSQIKDKVKIRVVNNGRSHVKEALDSVAMETPNLEKVVLKDGPSLEEQEWKFQENDKRAVTDFNGDSEEKGQNSTPTLAKRSDLEEVDPESSLVAGLKSIKLEEEIDMKPSVVGVLSVSKMVNEASKNQEASRENAAANKCPSKLHEKLAFLERKVEKIASDIKKTKEILDSNNPDTSKMMLSDIQEKITGIEKAMVFVKSGEQNQDEKEKEGVKDTKRSTAKGLNSEELEARLFPHHKLIRDRTLSKSTVRVSESAVASVSKEESDVGLGAIKLQDMDDSATSVAEGSSFTAFKENIDALLMADERLNEFDDEESGPAMISEDEVEENYTNKMNAIGGKNSTGGWFVSEGESVLLAHDDGSCSFYDIANSEEKALYNPPAGVFPNMWQDCWIIRAPNSDGLSGKYVVAASAGNSIHSGFCSWDFYTRKIHSFHFEDETTHVRTALAPLSNNTNHRRLAASTATATENKQWWYRPCGPLIMSGCSTQRMIQIFDIRDGDHVMKWELQKPISAMDYASPLQWRNKGKVAIAESDAVSLWDVSSLSSRPLLSVSSSGRKISALHLNNSDAELGGGVRQRVSPAEVEGNDGVFCTSDSINLLDFRQPSGIAFKIPKVGLDAHSSFSRGDSIYIGCSSLKSAVKQQYSSQIMQFSLRKQRLVGTYLLPESHAHNGYTSLTQVWGNSNYVMGVCGLGLFVFDSLRDDRVPSFTTSYSNTFGPDDMYYPSFDYLSTRVLLISRDRPAQWRYFF